MEDAFSALKIMLALAFYTSVYVLPLAVVGSALVRMALRWHRSWRLITSAALAALPQALFLTVGRNEPDWALFGFSLLGIAGFILLWRAGRGHGGAKMLLDIAIFFVALFYVMSGVNWIVG